MFRAHALIASGQDMGFTHIMEIGASSPWSEAVSSSVSLADLQRLDCCREDCVDDTRHECSLSQRVCAYCQKCCQSLSLDVTADCNVSFDPKLQCGVCQAGSM